MGSYGNLDTYNWTPGFVSTNGAECLRVLRMTTSTVEEFLREKNYPHACFGMRKISVGLIKMQNEGLGNFDKQTVLLAFMMPAVAVLGLIDADAPESSRREAALHCALGMATNPDHELAPCYTLAKDLVDSYIADLRSGVSLAQIKRKYNFPADIFDALNSLDEDLSDFARSGAPSSSSSSPSSSGSPIGCIAAVLLIAAIIGGLVFRGSHWSFKKESPASSDSSSIQQTESPPEDTPEPPPEDTPEPDQPSGFIFPNSGTATSSRARSGLSTTGSLRGIRG